MKVIQQETISDDVLGDLDRRDVALWIRQRPRGIAESTLAQLIRLPWKSIFSESPDLEVLAAAIAEDSPNDAMVQRRGFIQVIDNDPSRTDLPRRCLPIYLLNGRMAGAPSDFAARFRRMAMLEELRRSNVRHLVILSDAEDALPSDLIDLWSAGFRALITFITNAHVDQTTLGESLGDKAALSALALIEDASGSVVDILSRYNSTYPDERRVIRIRDNLGGVRRVDVTSLDDPDRPLLDRYDLIEERHLAPIAPEQLSEASFAAFFHSSDTSWDPYAAGLPWVRDEHAQKLLSGLLEKLDVVGPEENCVAFIQAEPGAGGSTLARMLAWECAREGYPVLVAKPLPFVPESLAVANYLNRVRLEITASGADPNASTDDANSEQHSRPRRYEVPWLVVFDRVHWELRDTELRRFRNEMEQQGRPVCILVVAGPVRELGYFDTSTFKQVAELTHALELDETRQLGRHLNSFLRAYGKPREEHLWDAFYQDHTIRYLEGLATFWISLSFWIRGQFDLSESIQERIYKMFLERTETGSMQEAILEIAALSTERLPLPEGLLPTTKGEWPLSHLLEDRRSALGALGLTRIAVDGQKHWALVHDILGRLIINALFYDFGTRERLGYAEATDAEHLRFLILRNVSQKPAIAERSFRTLADDFATTIFKIDPSQGRASLAPYWRDVLAAIDAMPRPLRDNSRVFRHHSAVSRRRIAKLEEYLYQIDDGDRIKLLEAAIEDINYALQSIPYVSGTGSEPDLNLYNSLAHAYHDLADLVEADGQQAAAVEKLRELARNATRRAYEESPTNSFVIETYVRDLLSDAKRDASLTVASCIEALGVLFTAISSNAETYRRAQLGDLADKALDILLRSAASIPEHREPAGPVDVLVQAWIALTEGVDHRSGTALIDLPEPNRMRALEHLSHQAGKGNLQVIRLAYELTAATHPFAFARQLEYLEQLQASHGRSSPQMQLEYGILLYQVGRPVEGDKVFRALRRIWRETEHFVQVPQRLRWLRERGLETVQTVQATIGSDRDFRMMARVSEFRNLLVPFRAEEFALPSTHPGARFAARVSFGHNGPFLRPVTVRVT